MTCSSLCHLQVQAYTVCVGFDDILAETIPHNSQHISHWTIITSNSDVLTQALCKKYGLTCYKTDSFYENGAHFNKGAAVEEATLNQDKAGWRLILDADIVLPEKCIVGVPAKGNLYTPIRRNLELDKWSGEYDLSRSTHSRDTEWSGYFQLFHNRDRVLKYHPWYATNFNHAGGGDCYFQAKWHSLNKKRTAFAVLHLGERDANWFGRATPRLDGGEVVEDAKNKMESFLRYKGWGRPKTVRYFDEHISDNS